MTQPEDGALHVPVMLREVRTLFESGDRPRTKALDCTLGAGGHALELLSRHPELQYTALDADPESIARALPRLGEFSDRLTVSEGYFDETLARHLRDEPSFRFDFVLFDLGLSIHHYRDSGRGFSFLAEEPLDMRLSPEAPRTAADIVATLREEELADLIFTYGEERYARRIARAIVEKRRKSPILNSAGLAAVVADAIPPSRGSATFRPARIHPATRTFQALRIAVNDELGRIERALPLAAETLLPGGLLVVISFHSLEDGIVKRFFREICKSGKFRELFRTPLEPGEEERDANPPSRSAKLRAISRLLEGEEPAARPRRGETPRELSGGAR